MTDTVSDQPAESRPAKQGAPHPLDDGALAEVTGGKVSYHLSDPDPSDPTNGDFTLAPPEGG